MEDHCGNSVCSVYSIENKFTLLPEHGVFTLCRVFAFIISFTLSSKAMKLC